MVSSELKAFLSWCGQFKDFPYSEVSYWINAYERKDGRDMYGALLQKPKS